MAAVVLGDETLLDDLQAGLIEPAGVADRIGLAPPHRCISAEPALFGAGPGALADGHQQPERLDRLRTRSEEHTSELQSHLNIVCRLLLEKKKKSFMSALLGSASRVCFTSA